jgi:IS5 family transposase
VINVVAHALESRWPQSRRRGRPGSPAEVVIRMLILKHLFDWSYDDLEQEVRPNLVYRAFTRIDAGDVPDAKTILKIARALGPTSSSSCIDRSSRSPSVPGSRMAADFASTRRS